MKLRYPTIIIGLLAWSTIQTNSATPTPQPKEYKWGGLSSLTGVPTPLEEYGLTLGDITTTRIFNPIGQLKNNDSIIISRQIEDIKIVNPWQELTPGTGLIVDGKKAVILEIQPAIPPSDEEAGLRIKLRVKEISGTEMTLEWEQESHKLNWVEKTGEERDATVEKLKNNLRAGTHLIINGKRSVITEKTIHNASPTSIDNQDMDFTAHYYAIKGQTGTLSGKPNPTGDDIPDAAWQFRLDKFPMANNTVQLLTWKFRARDGDADFPPVVTVLHRARGVVSNVELLEKDLTNVDILLTHNGKIFTHQINWKQVPEDVEPGSSWQLQSTADDFIEVYRVNDSNIQFTITPKSLIKANQEASKFFNSKKHNTAAQQLSLKLLDAETMATQITNLVKIVNSDASETIKIDAKRQALIYLARFYEHQADWYMAREQEETLREEAKLRETRKYERYIWLTHQKMKLLLKKNGSLENIKATEYGLKTAIKSLSFAEAYKQLEDYSIETTKLNGNGLKIEYARLKGKYETYKEKANSLRPDEIAIQKSEQTRSKYEQEAKKNYNLSLQFWSEYIYRTEGLKEGARKLGEGGIEGNTIPQDPYLPEIFLRQAWIYRKLGLTDRAISTYYDVLTGATKQKIDNLTRFGRIALVAQSQIANCFYEDAEDGEDLSEAINLYKRLLPTPSAFDNQDSGNQELDSSQVRLKLLRALFKADEQSRKERRRLERAHEFLINKNKKNADLAQIEFDKAVENKEYDTEREKKFAEDQIENLKELHEAQKIETEKALTKKIMEIEERRTRNWKDLKSHTEKYIERYATTGGPDLNHSGEVAYYKIMANKALGNEERVERDMHILLNDESTPDQIKRAWLATRVRIVIDISNLLYSTAIRQDEAKTTGIDIKLKNALPEYLDRTEYLSRAIAGYKYALNYDQTYRSQIMLRQQIAFCQELLKQNEDAIKTYETIRSLCTMHPYDLSPTLKVTQNLTNLKLKNLQNKEDREDQAKN